MIKTFDLTIEGHFFVKIEAVSIEVKLVHTMSYIDPLKEMVTANTDNKVYVVEFLGTPSPALTLIALVKLCCL